MVKRNSEQDMGVDREIAVKDFLALAQRCQDSGWTARELAREMTAWYRAIRIQNASIDERHDMLLFQWGSWENLDLYEPLDLRDLGDANFRWTPEGLTIDMTRQVFASADDEDEFDKGALQMHITLMYFDDAGGTTDGNMWIGAPEKIDESLRTFAEAPFIRSFIDTPPARCIAYVEYCG